MNKYFGFVSFYKEENIKQGDIITKGNIIYQNIEDSLRFFSIGDDIIITKVSTQKYENLTDSDYYEYFNMKKSNLFVIEKIYSYDEIIEIMASKGKNEEKINRFLQKFKIKEEDKQKFIELGPWIKKSLELFQGQEEKILVKKYGQNNNKGC